MLLWTNLRIPLFWKWMGEPFVNRLHLLDWSELSTLLCTVPWSVLISKLCRGDVRTMFLESREINVALYRFYLHLKRQAIPLFDVYCRWLVCENLSTEEFPTRRIHWMIWHIDGAVCIVLIRAIPTIVAQISLIRGHFKWLTWEYWSIQRSWTNDVKVLHVIPKRSPF